MHEPLTREQVKQVIEGKAAAPRVPMAIHFWTNPQIFGEGEEPVRELLRKYPNDIRTIGLRLPDTYNAPADDPGFRWMNKNDPYTGQVVGHDAKVAIADWSELDDVLADFPNPDYPGLIPEISPENDRYRLGVWWYCLFERHWSLRGMENCLTDFYEEPEMVHRLYRSLTDFYLRVMERAKNELDLDGVFTSDDIGMQTGPFFSRPIFEEFFKPYYRELFAKAHELGMHFWLHTCGNIEPYIPDFIEIGLDVLHPIQKYTMDEAVIAERYGQDICLWAGFDVQRIIPYGTPDEVRQEVRFMIDTYYRRDGRFMLTAGNGLTADCPYDSLEALLDESLSYGARKARGDNNT